MFLKNRSFNVKLVKDGDAEIESRDPLTGVVTAQAYAELADGVVKSVAETAITVILVKTACDVVKIVAKAVTK